MKFIYSLQSEWLKTKRSAASWLCIIGGFFIPTMYLIYFFVKSLSVNRIPHSEKIWEDYYTRLMSNMEVFLLPMGMILASSLITQMEYKNNTWKQLHTTPQSYTTIFLSKFTVIGLMMAKFFIFFNLGIILSGLIPSLILDHKFPEESFPVVFLLKANLKVFILCLPIAAIQYLISLHFKNFLVPVGIGLVGLIGTMIGVDWEYIYISPFSYTILDVMKPNVTFSIYKAASISFFLIMGISYLLYIKKKEKG